MGKGAVDERHPLSLGVVGNVMGALSPQVGVRGYVREADLVVLVGTRTNENGTDGWKLLPEQATFVHVDVDGREVGRNYPALPLVGDAGLALADLREALAGRSLATCRRVGRRWSRRWRVHVPRAPGSPTSTVSTAG